MVYRREELGNAKVARCAVRRDSPVPRKRETASAFVLCSWSFEKRLWHRREKDALRKVIIKRRMICSSAVSPWNKSLISHQPQQSGCFRPDSPTAGEQVNVLPDQRVLG